MVIPDCSRDSEFDFSGETLARVRHDTFSATGIGRNYLNYWAGVYYWALALRDQNLEALRYLEPIPMTYTEYRLNLHPECPITASNLYTVEAIDCLAKEARAFFLSERAKDPKSQDYVLELYMKAKFLILGPEPS